MVDVCSETVFTTNRYHPSSPHSLIARVKSTEDVVKVVKISRKYRIPVTAYSGGTSLEGHFGGVRLKQWST